jgi:hypothetical protein
MSDPAVSFSPAAVFSMPAVALLAPAILTAAGTLHAQQKADSNETLKIGLIGCGGRGTGAAAQALGADYNAKIVAMADAFDTQIENSIKNLSTQFPDRVDVKPDKKFTGLDAYQKLIDSGVDVVLLASPPGFRPLHLTAAVEAGKHIFCEKPMAVDAAGYRVAQAAVEKRSRRRSISWPASAGATPPAASSATSACMTARSATSPAFSPPTMPGRSNPCRLRRPPCWHGRRRVAGAQLVQLLLAQRRQHRRAGRAQPR